MIFLDVKEKAYNLPNRNSHHQDSEERLPKATPTETYNYYPVLLFLECNDWGCFKVLWGRQDCLEEYVGFIFKE